MASTPSKSRRRVLPHPAVRGRAAGLALAIVLGSALSLPAGAAGEASVEGSEEPVIGREVLIGKLVPITGDPLEARSVDLRVEFRRNSAELTESAVAQLRELGEALVAEALRDVPLGLYGHTDTSGPAEFNRELSERRAQAVAAYLRGQFGIAETRFREVRGYGEERPRQDLRPDAPAQRRVEIVTFHALSDEGSGDKEVGAAPSTPSDRPATAVRAPGDDGVAVPGAGEPAPRAREEGREDGEKRKRSGYTVIE